jgi:hypothetical protein
MMALSWRRRTTFLRAFNELLTRLNGGPEKARPILRGVVVGA